MEIKSLKTYQPPVMEVLDMELEQSVLQSSVSNHSNTENLNEEDFNW